MPRHLTVFCFPSRVARDFYITLQSRGSIWAQSLQISLPCFCSLSTCSSPSVNHSIRKAWPSLCIFPLQLEIETPWHIGPASTVILVLRRPFHCRSRVPQNIWSLLERLASQSRYHLTPLALGTIRPLLPSPDSETGKSLPWLNGWSYFWTPRDSWADFPGRRVLWSPRIP